MLRILVVCTGNTCRSPMAEALLCQKIEQAGMKDKIKVFSAGIAAGGHYPASAEACAVMAMRGITLEKHVSRQVTPGDIKSADLILTMTASHKRAILALAPEASDKVYMLSEYAKFDCDVADPYGGSHSMYQMCAEQIEKMLTKAWDKIFKQAGNKH